MSAVVTIAYNFLPGTHTDLSVCVQLTVFFRFCIAYNQQVNYFYNKSYTMCCIGGKAGHKHAVAMLLRLHPHSYVFILKQNFTTKMISVQTSVLSPFQI